MFKLSLFYKFLGGRSHISLMYLSNLHLAWSLVHFRCLFKGGRQEPPGRCGVRETECMAPRPLTGAVIWRDTFIWGRRYSERCKLGWGRWGRRIGNSLWMSCFWDARGASQWTYLKSASLLAFERWLVSVGGDRNYYHNHYNSSSITGTLLGGSISINSNSHNYDKEALFSRDEETGLNRSIISPRLHDWPVKWDSHPLPPLLTFSPLPSNTLRLFTKMAAGIPPIPVCPFVIWTCC